MKKPLGKLAPWVWAIELVQGCNLKCWHCTAPLHDEIKYMSLETWTQMCKIMNEVTPHRRLELAQGGEPTLHPKLLEFLRIAREITPTTQIQVTTNGLTLLSGKLTFAQIFEAGAHSIYVDMYDTVDKFIELAKTSGAEWYKYDKPKQIASSANHRMANTYYNDPNMRLIILQDHPEERLKWRKVGRLSTLLNHTDWDKCLPYGLVPVREPYKRKCTMPIRMTVLDYKGNYVFCCVDFWGESANQTGNVSQGVEGFKEFWFGRFMQSIRRHLRVGDRSKIPYCSRCNCAFSKCDWVRMWPDNAYELYFDKGKWHQLPSEEKDMEVFADGWNWHKKTTEAMPSIEKETSILLTSDKRIIHSDKVVRKKLT